MGEVHTRPVGRHALLVEVDDAEAAARPGRPGPAAAASMRSTSSPPRTPCSSTASRTSPRLVDGLAHWVPSPAAAPGASSWRSRCVYDGADLDDVAAAVGRRRRDRGGRARTRAPSSWSAFCGFAPGFAYLHRAARGLAVPRLDAPRTRVPAGSVALAGAWCGVYPTASPGGWRILGHHRRRPLGPGPRRRPRCWRPAPGSGSRARRMTLRVLEAGPLDHRPGPRPARLGPPRRPALRRPGPARPPRCQPAGRQRRGAALPRGDPRRAPVRGRGGRWVAVTGAACAVTRRRRGRGASAGPVGPGGGGRCASGRPRRRGAVLRRGRGRHRRPRRCSAPGPPTPWPGSGRRRSRPATVLPVGEPVPARAPLDTPRPPRPGPLRLRPGPRDDWFARRRARPAVRARRTPSRPDSNRVGLRLAGAGAARAPGPASCRARAWCSAPSRCRRRAAGGVPGRPPDDRRLPGGRGRGRGRPVAVRPAAARGEVRFTRSRRAPEAARR